MGTPVVAPLRRSNGRTVVDLVCQAVADPLALQPQLGALLREHAIVGLHDGQLGDVSFEPSKPEFAPPGSQRAET